MALLADNDVVVDHDPERLARAHDLLGHPISAFDGVGSPEGWLCTSTMGGCRQLQRPLHHLAHIDRGVIDGAGLLHLVGDDLIALVEEDDADCSLFSNPMVARQ